MTVKQLMRKLKFVPEDYEVTIFNSIAFVSGTYKADGINIDEDNRQVEISSKHTYLWDWWKQKWVK